MPSRIKDDFELRLTIQRGRTDTAMHGWEDLLSKNQIKDLVAYIRTVVPRDPEPGR
jgi:mono/diheme cytochrome c family protein